MIAPDDDRRRYPPVAHELVDSEAGLGAVPVAEPADARREALERDAIRRQLEPALQEEVVREELEQRPVDRCDVVRIPRERGPAERADAAAEERPDIGRDKARVCESVLDACLLCLPRRLLP